MIDPVSFLVLLILTVGLSHLVRPRHRLTRLFWITAPGALLLFVIHQRALALAVASLLAGTIVYGIGRAVTNTRVRARIPYLVLLMLLVPDVANMARDTPLLFLGSAFFIIRQMMTVAQAIKSNAPLTTFIPAILIATFFVAAVPSGPVFSGLTVWRDLGKADPANNQEGIYRLFEGFVHLFALAGFAGAIVASVRVAVDNADTAATALALQATVLPIGAFAVLFTTFYGYSRMAEGTALLLGFSVPQNFDHPHQAVDLGDYWKRWHRSMADFVMQYIYLPVLVTTKQAKIALIAAFVFMGLWHNFSLPFMIWGIGHGLGLGLVLPWAKRREVRPSVIRSVSLIWVLALSSVAHRVWL